MGFPVRCGGRRDMDFEEEARQSGRRRAKE